MAYQKQKLFLKCFFFIFIGVTVSVFFNTQEIILDKQSYPILLYDKQVSTNSYELNLCKTVNSSDHMNKNVEISSKSIIFNLVDKSGKNKTLIQNKTYRINRKFKQLNNVHQIVKIKQAKRKALIEKTCKKYGVHPNSRIKHKILHRFFHLTNGTGEYFFTSEICN